MTTMAYADPPYPGCAHLYSDDPNACEVNHEALIGSLCLHYPDGWALSTSSPALRSVLAMCPPDVRVAAWVKPFPGSGAVGDAWKTYNRQREQTPLFGTP